MEDIIVQPRPFDPEAFARATVLDAELSSSLAEHLHWRVTALEEAVSAPGPLRWLRLARLGRSIRSSAEPCAWAGSEWRCQRTEDLHAQWLGR